MYPGALFYCSLNDGTVLATFVYEDLAEGEFSPFHFKVVRFNKFGDVLQVSPKFESVDGEFSVSDVSDSILQVTSHVVDVCYDATHRYTLNIKTGELKETSEGGDDSACWREINARGGV